MKKSPRSKEVLKSIPTCLYEDDAWMSPVRGTLSEKEELKRRNHNLILRVQIWHKENTGDQFLKGKKHPKGILI